MINSKTGMNWGGFLLIKLHLSVFIAMLIFCSQQLHVYKNGLSFLLSSPSPLLSQSPLFMFLSHFPSLFFCLFFFGPISLVECMCLSPSLTLSFSLSSPFSPPPPHRLPSCYCVRISRLLMLHVASSMKQTTPLLSVKLAPLAPPLSPLSEAPVIIVQAHVPLLYRFLEGLYMFVVSLDQFVDIFVLVYSTGS